MAPPICTQSPSARLNRPTFTNPSAPVVMTPPALISNAPSTPSTPAFKMTSPSARNVRMLSESQLISDATVMLPFCVSVGSPSSGVETVTLLLSRFRSSRSTERIASSSFAAYSMVPSPTSAMPDEASSAIVRLCGSNSSVPVAPCGARVSTSPLNASVRFPETSTKPPSPPTVPPRAEIWPAKSVLISDQRMTRPPSPACPASAVMTVSTSTPR